MNTLKKDIVVKNSVKPRTYMDYETGRLFYETSLLVEGGIVNGWLIHLPDEVYQKIIKYYYQNYVVRVPPHLNYPNGLIMLGPQLNKIRRKFNTDYKSVRFCGCRTKKGTKCKAQGHNLIGYVSVIKRTDPHWRKEKDLVLDENEFRELATIDSIVNRNYRTYADSDLHNKGWKDNENDFKIRFKCCGRHDIHRYKHKGYGIGLDRYLEWNGIKLMNGYVCRTDKKLTY